MSILYSRKSIAAGVGYTAIVDRKFKTNRVMIRMLTRLSLDSASANAVALNVLSSSNCQDRTLKELTARLNSLYGANIGTNVVKRGDVQILTLSISAIENQYAFDGEDVTAESLEILLQCLFSPNVENGAFDASIFRARKKDLLDAVDAEINNKRRYALLHAQQTVFAGEPAAYSSYGTRETAEAVTAESAFAAYQQLLETAEIEIYAVTATEQPAIAKKLTEAFTGRKRHPLPVSVFSPSQPKTVPAEITEQMNVGQSKLVMAFKSDCTDRRAMMLMNNLFGETPYAKLFLNVRQKLSLCYYCASNYAESKQTLLVDCGIEYANLTATRNEILNQLSEMQQGNFTDAEIDNALLSIENNLQGVGDTAGGWVDWYFTQQLRGTTDTPEDEIAQIQEMAVDRQALRARLIAAANSLTLDTIYLMQQRADDGQETAGEES